ncbi:helix-turn-helix transcriptional regulator [Collimonas antrihumi]|uniref:helix-turn-helix transcriptional regulator n=1 Tax=Collimonas antrihumi TaxID=1940615 RepID=UPI001B8B2572|nr:AlpA family phage regulatory protein [Collimonas antrihumi]
MQPKLVINTPSAPQRRVVRHNNLPEIVGLSKSTIFRLIRAGEFPAAFRLSNQAVGFDLAEIEAWIAGRKATRQEVAA